MQSSRQSMVKKVLKFGGSSLNNPAFIENVLDIILTTYASTSQLVVVFSAFGNVTDQLIELGQKAKAQTGYSNLSEEIKQRHIDTAIALLPHTHVPFLLDKLDTVFNDLNTCISTIIRNGELSKKSLDELMGYGEKMSTLILCEALKQYIANARLLNAETIIVTDRNFGQGLIDFKITNDRIINYFKSNVSVVIVPGFIAATKKDEPITLGRGGSDYTAAVLGAALDSDVVELWTDVDGIMTADPKKDCHASVIPELNYEKAMELSLLGAKVIHCFALLPISQKNIPILIKNSFRKEAPGTLIRNSSPIVNPISSFPGYISSPESSKIKTNLN